MVRRQITEFKLWRLMVLAVICWIIAAGFWQDLSADNEATYKGLKIFSDVLDIVEQNYVEPVESRELIEKAIQGMIQSLDPHSAFLPPEALEALQMDTQGEFGGIGIEITMQKGHPHRYFSYRGHTCFQSRALRRETILSKSMVKAQKT